MSGSRTAIGVGCCALALALAFGCGGAVEHGDATAGGPGAAGTASGHAGASSFAGATETTPDGGLVDPDPVDTGCDQVDLPPPELACDPFAAGDCGPGQGCYPFVDHPEGSGCDQQRYGTVCLPAGSGTQGQLCGETASDWCAPGFVCVVGQRAGKRCAALCELGTANKCSGGLICGDLDVAGFGVCG
jgi:hypothetical protein